MTSSETRQQYKLSSDMSKQPESIELHSAYMQLITAYLQSNTSNFTSKTIQDVEDG